MAAVILFIASYSNLNISTTVKSYAANTPHAALEESKPVTVKADSLIAPACTDNNTY